MLKTKHFFPFIKMVKALDIKDELKEMYRLVKENPDNLEQLDEEKGIDFLFLLIEKLPNAEREVMNFLSVFLDMTVEEVQEMELDETVQTIYGVFTDPNFKVFFQRAVK